MALAELKTEPGMGDCSSDEEMYNPSKQPGTDIWEPDPQTIIELYEKLDKDGFIELEWKSPGRIPIHKETTPVKQEEIVQETPEEVIKLQQKQNMLSMFEEDDLSNKVNTPTSLSKTPKTPKTVPKVKASFDKIFNRVSLQSMSNNKGGDNPPPQQQDNTPPMSSS